MFKSYEERGKTKRPFVGAKRRKNFLKRRFILAERRSGKAVFLRLNSRVRFGLFHI